MKIVTGVFQGGMEFGAVDDHAGFRVVGHLFLVIAVQVTGTLACLRNRRTASLTPSC
jgi:hypothetical protein